MTWREWLTYRRMVSRAMKHTMDLGYPVSPAALVLIKQQCRQVVLDNVTHLTHTPVWVPNDRLAAVQAVLAGAKLAPDARVRPSELALAAQRQWLARRPY